MTEETEWIGGQFTSQAIPPDEYPWIEHVAPTTIYNTLRHKIRDYYYRNFPLSDRARQMVYLNPGNGGTSALSCEPRAALAAFTELLAPYTHSGRLTILTQHVIHAASIDGDRVAAVTMRNVRTGDHIEIAGRYVLDATDCGDVLPLAGIEHVTGAESRDDTGESLAMLGPARPGTMEAFTWAMVLDHLDGEDHTIERPQEYDFFRTHVPAGWPGPQLSWKVVDFDAEGVIIRDDTPPTDFVDEISRRIAHTLNFQDGLYQSNVACFNAPQNVYMGGPAFGLEAEKHRALARQLSLSVVYWLQTEAPRPDGGQGYPGIRLRPDAVGTADGLAMAPYIRESRRIVAVSTLREQDVSGAECTRRGSTDFLDTVGIAHYYLDMWPRTEGGRPFLVPACPAQITLGSLIPIRVRNLLPACKNFGVTHIINSLFRMHAGEWAVGEAAGTLAASCSERHVEPHQIRSSRELLEQFQELLLRQGVTLRWPRFGPTPNWHAMSEPWRQYGRISNSILAVRTAANA